MVRIYTHIRSRRVKDSARRSELYDWSPWFVVIYILMQNLCLIRHFSPIVCLIYQLEPNLVFFFYFFFCSSLCCLEYKICRKDNQTCKDNKSAFSGYVLSKKLYHLSIGLMRSSNRLCCTQYLKLAPNFSALNFKFVKRAFAILQFNYF